VKGIDAKAREVAKDLARRSGMTLGEWLNHMILEGEDVGAAISRERDRAEGRMETRFEARAEPRIDPQGSRRRPAYRETHNDLDDERRRPAAPYSSGARPLAARESRGISSSDLRRRSIFEDRPRDDDRGYDVASDELGRVARVLEALSNRIEGSETRSATAVRGVSSAVDSILDRLERSETAQTERFTEQTESLRAEQEESREALVQRLAQAERLIDAQAERLDGLSSHLREEREHIARLENELKSPAALDTIRTVEGALGKLANQLYEGEQRSRDTVKDIREDMVGLSHRLAQIEVRDPERAAQGVIDKVVARLAQRLEQAEAQTSGAIRALEQAFTTLDARLNRAEERGDVTDPEQVQSLSRLANELSRRVEDSRAELLRALDDRSNATAEQVLKAFARRVEQAEQRSAAAIEKLGADVMRVAETLNRRVSSVEAASHEGINRLGGEIGRVAEAVEARQQRADSGHAQALERLGNEIARISERLGQRMAENERRTAQAVEGIGQAIETHRDTARSELADRIRQSEERTAKMLDEARSRLDQKLAQTRTEALLAENALRNPAPARQAQAGQPAALPDPFGDIDDDDDAGAPPPSHKRAAPEPVAAPEAAIEAPPAAAEEPAFDPFAAEDLEYELVPAVGRQAGPADDADPFAEIETGRKTAPRPEAPVASGFGRGRATLDLADDLAEGDAPPQRQVDDDIDLLDEEPGVSVSTRDALAAARAAVRASIENGYDERPRGPLAGLGLKSGSRNAAKPAKAPKESTLLKAFKASGVAAGVVVLGGAAYLGVNAASHYMDDLESKAKAPPIAATAVAVPERADDNLLRAEFESASQALAARAPGAVDQLRHVAEQGYAPAQSRLGQIYSGAGNLVKPDPAAARLWTERAAKGGIADAMHNLGIMYYNGVGGSSNAVAAAIWFRKAAERGMLSSQYNIGLLYERGEGVPLDPSEAYKWLSIAARSGDKDAAREAAALRSDLTEGQRQKADAAVAAFKPVDGTSSAAPQG
jgi:localization factor PodJL